MNNILVISKHGPYHQQCLRESLDMVLIFAAIDQQVTWLLEGAAVLSLVKNQRPSAQQQKDFTKAIGMLEIYDIESVYVCADALNEHGLSTDDLAIEVQIAYDNDKRALIKQVDKVVTL